VLAWRAQVRRRPNPAVVAPIALGVLLGQSGGSLKRVGDPHVQ